MKKIFELFLYPPVTGKSSIIIIRLLTGAVFFLEGILKFVYQDESITWFTQLGITDPVALAGFIATAEIVGGLLMSLGLFTRLTAIYFILQIFATILSTQVITYPVHAHMQLSPLAPEAAVWAIERQLGFGFAQLMSCLFLLIEGAGRLSVDYFVYTLKDDTLKQKHELVPRLVHATGDTFARSRHTRN